MKYASHISQNCNLVFCPKKGELGMILLTLRNRQYWTVTISHYNKYETRAEDKGGLTLDTQMNKRVIINTYTLHTMNKKV